MTTAGSPRLALGQGYDGQATMYKYPATPGRSGERSKLEAGLVDPGGWNRDVAPRSGLLLGASYSASLPVRAVYMETWGLNLQVENRRSTFSITLEQG